jgi:hypothetical protein
MHEEKSTLHFSIIKQEVPEVGRPHGVHDVSYYSPDFDIFVFVAKQSLLDLQIFEVELLSHYSKTTAFSLSLRCVESLKGPKSEIFTGIRPVWVGDLETRPENLKCLCLGPYITLYFMGFLFKKLGAGSKKS